MPLEVTSGDVIELPIAVINNTADHLIVNSDIAISSDTIALKKFVYFYSFLIIYKYIIYCLLSLIYCYFINYFNLEPQIGSGIFVKIT